MYFNLGLMIIPCGDVKETRNGRSIEQDSFKTDLQGQNVFTLVTQCVIATNNARLGLLFSC